MLLVALCPGAMFKELWLKALLKPAGVVAVRLKVADEQAALSLFVRLRV